jgi:hypothetical protein
MKFSVGMMMIILLWGCGRENISYEGAPEREVDHYVSEVLNNESYLLHAADLQEMESAEAAELTALKQLDNAPVSQPSDEPFIFFVIGDSELLMRDNTYPQLENWILKINDIESYGLEFTSGDFDETESRAITKPELVLLAGDINKDRAFGFSLPGDANSIANQQTYQLFNQFDNDILFLAGNGNHDWDPYLWGDGFYGHNFGGLLSNLGTAKFVRSGYFKSLNATDEIYGNSFNYDRNAGWFQPTTSAEFNYSFVYRNVRFTQLNQFLYQPAAMVSFESIFGTGPAWYFPTRSENWFASLCQSSAEEQTPHVVIQHFPIYTGDSWWNDDLGSTPDDLRKRFLDIFQQSYQPVMFTGHNHFYRTTTVQPYGIVDHTSGYFADGFLMAAKASASKGIYAITYISLNSLSTTDPSVYSTSYTVPQ